MDHHSQALLFCAFPCWVAPLLIVAMPPALPKIAPQLCHAVHEPPTASGWLHEIKHDGHRIIATVEHGRVRLVSRPGNDATNRFAPIAAWVRELPVKTAILDGEAAVPDERGVTHIDYLSAAGMCRNGSPSLSSTCYG